MASKSEEVPNPPLTRSMVCFSAFISNLKQLSKFWISGHYWLKDISSILLITKWYQLVCIYYAYFASACYGRCLGSLVVDDWVEGMFLFSGRVSVIK